jgi:outer membrane protein assembly factor BamB
MGFGSLLKKIKLLLDPPNWVKLAFLILLLLCGFGLAKVRPPFGDSSKDNVACTHVIEPTWSYKPKHGVLERMLLADRDKIYALYTTKNQNKSSSGRSTDNGKSNQSFLIALQGNTGKLVWQAPFQALNCCLDEPVAGDGIVCFVDVNNTLHSLNGIDGKEVWHATSIFKVIAIKNNMVFTTDENGRHVEIFSSLSGKLLAQVNVSTDDVQLQHFWSDVTIEESDNSFYIGDKSQSIEAFDNQTFKSLWKYSEPNHWCDWFGVSENVVTVYIKHLANSPGDFSHIVGLNALTGEKIWSLPVDENKTLIKVTDFADGKLYYRDVDYRNWRIHVLSGSTGKEITNYLATAQSSLGLSANHLDTYALMNDTLYNIDALPHYRRSEIGADEQEYLTSTAYGWMDSWLTALNPLTGEVLWSSKRIWQDLTNLTAADGMIFVLGTPFKRLQDKSICPNDQDTALYAYKTCQIPVAKTWQQ